MRSTLGRRRELLFGFILAGLLLLFFELLLQGFYYATVGDFLFRRVMPSIAVEDPKRCYRMRSDLDYVHRTNEFSSQIYTNALGMRTDAARETPAYEKPEGVYRILFLGPSFTFGWGSDHADIYPTLIAQGLNVGDRRVEVINLGTPAQGPAPQICWLQAEGYRYQPDLIVQTSYGSEVVPIVGECPKALSCPVIIDGNIYSQQPTLKLRVIAQAKNSALVFYGWSLVGRLGAGEQAAPDAGKELYGDSAPLDPGDTAGLAAQYQNYLTLINHLLGEQTEVVFVHIPLSYMVHTGDVSRWKHLGDINPAGARAQVAAQVAALKERGIEMIDATPGLYARAEQQRLYYWLDIHFTPAGNHAFAEEVLPRVQAAVDAQLQRRAS